MTELEMLKRLRTLVKVSICAICLVVLSMVGVDWCVDHADVDPHVVEQEIRASLPAGSSLSAVDTLLGRRGIEHSYDASSKTILAVVRKVKGSTLLIRDDLGFQFRFDDSLKLQSIDSKLHLTGP